MANSAKRKGDRAELEIQGWFWDELGVKARRALGAGRKDDVGDIHGVPDTVVSVANYADLDRAGENAGAAFAAMFVRRRGGHYVVVMTPEQFAALWREAA
jgi:hypothetical protein